MAKRQKKTVISGVTRETADAAFTTFTKADASINKIQAEIELQCAKIREKWQDKLATLSTEREQAFDTLQAWATENRAELFSKRKSLEMAQGMIGFRTGTPKLKTLKGFTWASALELVKAFMPDRYIRRTEEIAKEILLADRDLDAVSITDGGNLHDVPMSQAMSRCGIQVIQDETFFVEPKSEDAA